MGVIKCQSKLFDHAKVSFTSNTMFGQFGCTHYSERPSQNDVKLNNTKIQMSKIKIEITTH